MSTKSLVALKWSSANTEKSTWDAHKILIMSLKTNIQPIQTSLIHYHYSIMIKSVSIPEIKLLKGKTTRKEQEIKTTGELDPVDVAYQMFKKLRIEETRLKR